MLHVLLWRLLHVLLLLLLLLLLHVLLLLLLLLLLLWYPHLGWTGSKLPKRFVDYST
jgi:hypothetical protein